MPEEQTPRSSDSAPEARQQQQRADPTRKRRRDQFLADLAEAQQLRERVAPRRARMARLRQQQLMRTFFH